MYENDSRPEMVKRQIEHMQIAEKMANEISRFSPDEQNEVIQFLRKASIDERQMKADKLRAEAEFLLKSCEALH